MENFSFEEEIGIGQFTLHENETEIGQVTFKINPETGIDINHTYVKPEFEGNGFGKKLVDRAIQYAKDNDMAYTGSCWFADKVIQSYDKK